MKKTLWMLLALSLAGSPLFAGNDFAKKTIKADSAPRAESKAAQASSAPKKDGRREDMKKKIEELKAQLNGSEWEVEMSAGGKALGKDAFTFQNGQVTCKTLKDKGYPATNYTISQPEGADMATWETMQTSPKGDVVFIRGEWAEEVMRGVMSEQLPEGKSKDYNFASVTKTAVPPTTEKKEEKKPQSTPSEALTSMETAPPGEEVPAFAPGTTDELEGVRSKKA